MDTAHEHHEPRSGPEEWDERYREDDNAIWSGHPNGSLVAEVSDLPPGRALDVGCGEGADAIWLASRGWQVTGIDISQVALDRAAAAAGEAGVEVEWMQGDFVAGLPTAGAYDLVAVHYPALLKSAMDDAIAALLVGVAPGGTLLFVGHAPPDPAEVESHGVDPDDYVQPGDVAERLGADWTIEVWETRERVAPATAPVRHSHDTILRATRRG
jgi:SAM-dependent methyltransferase